jgi:PAS domain S-box-containing protein
MAVKSMVSKEQLNKEHQKFEALFQNASLGILVIDQNGDIILVNDFLLIQFGYKEASDLVGKKIEILIPSRFHKHHVHDREGYTKHPSNRPMGIGRDLFGQKHTGEEFPVEISLSSYSNDEGRFSIAFISDISKRKEIEQAVYEQQLELAEINKTIERLNQELEQKVASRTEQLQATMTELEASRDELSKALSKEKELGDLKSRFVSMASHEFRTPLSTILSSASLLAKYTLTEDQDKRDRHINRIKSSVNNLTDILNEFLSLGKIEDGKVVANNVEFNIRDFVSSLCNEITGILKKGQKLQYDHQGASTIFLDPALLKNILINLLSNAIKFSREEDIIHISTRLAGTQFEMRVRDTGIGISSDDQKHLFERFFRGNNVTNIQGTGLGLHIVSKYIELLNGNIAVESELEKGTEFIINFEV